MAGSTLTTRPTRALGRSPHDARTDVKLASDWLDRWLLELDAPELRTYLQLAHLYNTRTYHDAETLGQLLAGPAGQRQVAKLEARGLVEVIRKDKLFHYHFPHRDGEAYHRAEAVRPSLADALAFQERMSDELMELTERDETPALREEVFESYPELREEYELYRAAADEHSPRWRLWMELSRLLIREFEQRYGSLKEDHGALFKEVSSKVLRHHLDVVDGVVAEVLARIDDVCPEVQDNWLIFPAEDDFVQQPLVKRLTNRFGIGPEQIFLNVLEALGDAGMVVVTTDGSGALGGMVLPTDTGLTKSEERVLFLTAQERAREDTPRNRERVKRARNKYANYLIDRAVSTLADFVAVGHVHGIDAWLMRIADMVNDALSLVPTLVGQRPVLLEHVIDRYDAFRQGIARRPEIKVDLLASLAARSTRDDAEEGPAAKEAAKKETAKKKAAKKKTAKKKTARKKTAKKKTAKKKTARKKTAKKKTARKKTAKKKTAKKKTAKKKTAKKKTAKKKTAKKKTARKKTAKKKTARKKAARKKAAKKKTARKKAARRR